jgi:hypothetical protein
MADPNEISALKASLRGAIQTADALAQLAPSVEAIDPQSDLAADDLDRLARATAAHAIASAALRGLVQTMLARRGLVGAAPGGGGGAPADE